MAPTLSTCSPIIGAGSLYHSMVTGNTAGIVSSGVGIAIEKNTGKTVGEHVLDRVQGPNTQEAKPERSRAEVLEELRNTLREYVDEH